MARAYRKRFNFWLDIGNDNDYCIAELIQTLKYHRQFTGAIRDGLRLICDLRAKRLDVLLELFPWIEEALREAVEPPDPDIQAEIAALKDLILSGNQAGNPRPLNVPQVRTPNFDDSSDVELTIKKDTSTDSAQNFLDSMLALQG